ncbi:type II secretion system protein [Sulfurovum sp.]|uniref:type II secretion system protein n=1 Tax=Sulfurovum sp. TaxID=1969726 RepID=UPI0028682C77|nr:type II secretion system protein [Sulfurovum sp.]
MKRTVHKNRNAFSMLELVFVIVILGIVASIGAEVIAKVYQSYILQRAQQRASVKTELASVQIANRLAYAIPGTVIRRVGKAGTPELITEALGSNPDLYSVLQWVGYDADSFGSITNGTTNRYPGWSGFCDLDASAGTTLNTPGSNLGLADTIIGNLSGTASLGVDDAAIYFPGYTIQSDIASYSGSTITLSAAPTTKVEHYKLAWTSYALVIEGGDLYLYHNFTPSPSAAIPAATVNNRSLLMTGITTFKFRGDGRTIRFKVCRSENIGDADFNVTACKEKAVF